MIIKNKSYEAVVEDLTLEGSGLCRVDGFAVFVPMTAVGDRIRFKAVKVQKNVGFGLLEQVITPSPARQQSDCPVFRQCGGCAFRHITYEEELRLKEKVVSDAFRRLGGFTLDAEPILGCPEEHHYRNKAQYPLGVDKDGHAVAGFYARRSHRIVPADNCLLQDESFGPIVRTVLSLIDRYKLPVYDEETGRGMLRHLFLRRGPSTGETMVCLVSTTRKIPYLNEICQALTAAFPEIVSITVNVNAERTNVILGRNTVTVWGKDTIDDFLCGVKLSIAPAAFYQVNSPQAQRLYELGYEYAGFKGNERLMDLYCGIGSIGLGAYRQVNSLVGVEVVPPAVESAKKNAAQNHMEHTEFFCADAGEAAVQLADRGETPDVIIIDPPRKGCDQDVIDSIARMAPEKVVMISCNPATAARDAKLLCEQGYELVRYRGVDMFPRTGHVETVALFVRGKADGKKRAFFENAKLLQDAMGITPLLYGSLGLEYLTGENLNADDIDILIPKAYITERWPEFTAVLEKNGYTLIDEHEHTFEKDGIHYAYAQIEELEPFAGICVSEIAELNEGKIRFKLLSLQQYLKVYTASAKDGYRVEVREKKDFDKIAFIEKQLQTV